VLSTFRGIGVEYLIDPDVYMYDDWSFHTPDKASQIRQVEG